MSDAGIEILRKGLARKEKELNAARSLYNAADFEGPPYIKKALANIEAAKIRLANREAYYLNKLDKSREKAATRVEGKDREAIAETINSLEDEIDGIKATLAALGADTETTE